MILSLFIIAIIISVTLNLSVLLYLYRKKSKLNVLELSLLSLSVSDLLQSGIGYSTEIISFTTEHGGVGKSCEFGGFLVAFLSLVSMLNLVGISMERCVVLKHPLFARNMFKNQKFAVIVIFLTWLLAFIYAIPHKAIIWNCSTLTIVLFSHN